MERVALEYGRFLLGLILTAFAGFVLFVFIHPQTGPNGQAFGWSMGLIVLFGWLAVGTLIGAPLSILLGIGALVPLRKVPGQPISKAMARLGLVLSITVVACLTAAYLKITKDAQSSQPHQNFAEADSQAAATITSEMDQLINDCDLYAHFHDDNYPSDSAGFENWIKSQDPKLSNALSEFDYYGGGVKSKPMAMLKDIEEGQGILILVAHNVLPDGSRLIGVRGEPMRSHVKTIRGSELRSWIEIAKGRNHPTSRATRPVSH